MKVVYALVAVAALLALPLVGAQQPGLRALFGTIVPYVALALFVGGLIYRVLTWAKSPVPFRITTTCGQQKTLDWIKHDEIENPTTTAGVIGRMALEILFFRSLFRNTSAENYKGRLVYGSTKWLWLAGLAFHWCFLLVLLRHLRFFAEPVPGFVLGMQAVDGFMEIGVPAVYVTGVVLLLAVTFLFLRRVVSPGLRYISLPSDYFPLFLIGTIASTGILLRHFIRTDIVGVKELAMGLVTFQPNVPDGVHPLFFGHLFLVCVLFAYLPFSKLTHMAGVFFSPTRNLANSNRFVRHVNPWAKPAEIHSYAKYEDEFREKMIQAGIPVERETAEEKPKKKKAKADDKPKADSKAEADQAAAADRAAPADKEEK
jgi:nitrate reductase gamma subunit